MPSVAILAKAAQLPFFCRVLGVYTQEEQHFSELQGTEFKASEASTKH